MWRGNFGDYIFLGDEDRVEEDGLAMFGSRKEKKALEKENCFLKLVSESNVWH